MKQRITYIVPNPDEFNPEQLNVKESTISLNSVKAVKEHRVTFGLNELPLEIRNAFEQLHEFHIRWASDRPYEAVPPFTSRVSPGLHILFSPQNEHNDSNFCPLLKKIFGNDLKCSTSNETSIKLPVLSERFSRSTSHQIYAYQPELSDLVDFIQSVCPGSSQICKNGAVALNSATSLDIDYDAISHALIINAIWSEAPEPTGWTETITLPGKAETIEVGVLNRENNPDPEDIQFAGFLTVLGQDTQPKATLFQTPARHYPLPASSPQTFTTSFQQPTGLHPTLVLTLPPVSSLQPPDPTCKLHTHLTLPSYLFIDKYQFSDPLALSSHNLASLRSIAGATDLEAPDWVVQQWGSAALFEIAIPSEDAKPTRFPHPNVDVTIPLHLRYLPAANTTHTRVPVPWPVVFWACRAEDGTKLAVNPFDRLHLGYEGLFGPRTRFVHVPPTGSKGSGGLTLGTGKVTGVGGLTEFIDVPVLDLRKTAWVELGTIGTVVVAFLGLCWALFASGGEKSGKGIDKDDKSKKKQ